MECVVQNGIVVLPPNHGFADGTSVIVTPSSSNPIRKPSLENLLELAGTVDDLPDDMARNHDHYLHGAPKR